MVQAGRQVLGDGVKGNDPGKSEAPAIGGFHLSVEREYVAHSRIPGRTGSEDKSAPLPTEVSLPVAGGGRHL